MSTSTRLGPHLFWILSRGAGTTALVLSSLSVAVGLFMAGRMRPGDRVARRAVHEALSLSVIVAIAVHGLVLIGDGFLHPGLLDVAVPFAWGYMRLATTLGIVAGWALVALGLSFYARDRIGRTIVEGTDAGTGWYVALLVVTTAPVLVLLAIRMASAPADFALVARAPAPVPREPFS
jgi:sulfoxide reductase heme-binding subunit YedZ